MADHSPKTAAIRVMRPVRFKAQASFGVVLARLASVAAWIVMWSGAPDGDLYLPFAG